ncbi:molybdopterin-dependent oxidoreductase [candidate division KSB1 bacterium]|nr:molybdopterin-dependent oxidoreductase [candidate division KSB1 bacterium]
MKNKDTILHVQGKSQFIDDQIVPEGTLYAAVVSSSIAHGKILKIDDEEARKINGIVCILTASDVPGQNQIGNIIKDETLLAENDVHYIGQPIAVILATDAFTARKAAKKINIRYEAFPAVFDPREAYKNGSLIAPERTFSCGNIDDAWRKCDVIVEGRVESGGQEHLYLETQGAFAIPMEHGKLKVFSSTQSPTIVQKTIAGILNILMHKIEVDVLRLGGGFGGKEDQATAWACMAALGVWKTGKPVKLVLRRHDDLRMTGKRHPYSSDFKIGLTNDYKIVAYEAMFYQNAGAAADLSTAILERTLFHTTNSYFIPNVKATAASCKTNLPPNTAFRGFGSPQAMFVIESAIHKAAEKMGVDSSIIQHINLLNEGDEFPFGMTYKSKTAHECWDNAQELYHVNEIINEIKVFNEQNSAVKKGMALMPICFGISFTTTFLNQASALVHVYSDGSVGISTAAVEMGQGVNTKIRQTAARVFSIDIERVFIETTNTTRIANTSPTAASSAADLNGNATRIACEQILCRLRTFALEQLKQPDASKIDFRDETIFYNNQPTALTWEILIGQAYINRQNLSAHAHYATPAIFFDRATEKGNAFAYHVCGTAISKVTLDCLRGTYTIDAVKIVHDGGTSINELIDRGQIEGALVQGIGWLTMEEVLYDEAGILLSNTFSAYKIPDIQFTPTDISIHFLESDETNLGVFNSKAIGEPPFMYAIGTYFALINAIKAFNPNVHIKYDAPMTPEKALLSLYSA